MALTKNHSLEMMIEMVRPELSRIAGLPVEILEVDGRTINNGKIGLFTRLFGGGICFSTVQVPDVLTTSLSAMQSEKDLMALISEGIESLVQELELIALVDYRWPRAA